MTMKQRVIAASSVAAVGLAGMGLAAGVALADSGSTPAASPTPSASPATGPHADKGKNKDKVRHLIAAKRVLHGEFVTSGKTGYVTMDAQRGSVTAVSPTSLSLKSADGFTATYALTAQATVRNNGTAGTLADVKVGGDATVVAMKSGSTLTVKGIVIGEKKHAAK